jgi:hypothetical protein
MSRWIRGAAALALLAITAGTITACGSDTERLSKADFVKQVDALCQAREKKFALLDDSNFFNLKEGQKVWTKLRPAVDTFVKGVDDLEPPADADKLMKSYRSTVEDAQGLVGKIISAAKGDDQKAYNQHVSDLINRTTVADKSLDDYGTHECYDEKDALPISQKVAAGATEVDVTAREYRFDIPKVKAGKVAFTLSNKGKEMHVFGFGRIKDGHTFAEVQAEAQKGGEPTLMGDDGLTALTGPDRKSTTNAELTKGTYVAYCFIPAPDGTPHLAKGMFVPFEVS